MSYWKNIFETFESPIKIKNVNKKPQFKKSKERKNERSEKYDPFRESSYTESISPRRRNSDSSFSSPEIVISSPELISSSPDCILLSSPVKNSPNAKTKQRNSSTNSSNLNTEKINCSVEKLPKSANGWVSLNEKSREIVSEALNRLSNLKRQPNSEVNDDIIKYPREKKWGAPRTPTPPRLREKRNHSKRWGSPEFETNSTDFGTSVSPLDMKENKNMSFIDQVRYPSKTKWGTTDSEPKKNDIDQDSLYNYFADDDENLDLRPFLKEILLENRFRNSKNSKIDSVSSRLNPKCQFDSQKNFYSQNGASSNLQSQFYNYANIPQQNPNVGFFTGPYGNSQMVKWDQNVNMGYGVPQNGYQGYPGQGVPPMGPPEHTMASELHSEANMQSGVHSGGNLGPGVPLGGNMGSGLRLPGGINIGPGVNLPPVAEFGPNGPHMANIGSGMPTGAYLGSGIPQMGTNWGPGVPQGWGNMGPGVSQGPNMGPGVPKGPNMGPGVPQSPNMGPGLPQGPNMGPGVPQGSNMELGVPQGPNMGLGVPQGFNMGPGVPQGPIMEPGVHQGAQFGSEMPLGHFPNMGHGGPQGSNMGPRIPQGSSMGPGEPPGHSVTQEPNLGTEVQKPQEPNMGQGVPPGSNMKSEVHSGPKKSGSVKTKPSSKNGASKNETEEDFKILSLHDVFKGVLFFHLLEPKIFKRVERRFDSYMKYMERFGKLGYDKSITSFKKGPGRTLKKFCKCIEITDKYGEELLVKLMGKSGLTLPKENINVGTWSVFNQNFSPNPINKSQRRGKRNVTAKKNIQIK